MTNNLTWTIALGLSIGAGVVAGLCVPSMAQDVRPAALDGATDRSEEPGAEGWLTWRGPGQAGASEETDLPSEWELGGVNDLWRKDLSGRGTPVIADGRVYAWGYRGEGADLQEVLVCLDPATGETIWEETFNDFLSDIIYSRYSIGAPAVDAETGNIYLMTTPGIVVCMTPEGERVWDRSMIERFGRLTFPNGRTGAPVIDGDLVIIHVISAYWGPSRDRFYAFDKRSGDLVWVSDPGVGPPYLKDSSFSTPVFAWDEEGRRVFYCGTGDGNIVCVNARTGEPIWRYQWIVGGINSSVVVDGDKVIAVHGKENLNNRLAGGMIALDRTAEPTEVEGGTPTLGEEAVIWRNGIEMFTSSPVLAEGRVYQLNKTGELNCVDAETGEILWAKKLGSSQLHASPLYADGKLYVPMNNGTFWILRPTDEGAEELSRVELEGDCLGSPSVWNGKVYVFTTEHLYCFGKEDNTGNLPEPTVVEGWPGDAGEAASLQPIPSDVLLEPGESRKIWVRAVDGKGQFARVVEGAAWSHGESPAGRLNADFNEGGELTAGGDAKYSAGVMRAGGGDGASGTLRGRVLPHPPFEEDFESFELGGEGAEGAVPPPSPWIGAGPKWEIREHDGSKVLAKTLDRIILQRAMSFIGHPDERDYTMRADVMTEGNRRLSGDVGIVNQRYLIALKGNSRQLEISSNYERIDEGVPFDVQPDTWYTIKSRVDVAEDGSGVIRAKAWERGTEEPEEWMLEVNHRNAHRQGAPGVYGLAPQNLIPVYIDNIRVTPNGADGEG